MRTNPRFIALAGVLTALVMVVTRFVVVPVGQGFFNFSDVAIYFIAFAFGPWMGLIAGGLGTALADISLGYASFAPLTFLAHGLQGFLAGYLYDRVQGAPLNKMLVGWFGGTIAMAGIYFVGEFFGAAFGWGGPAQATAEVVPNLLQNVGGGIVAIPLVILVQRAYPLLARFRANE
ncbi:MAG: ECF transporter S component [Ardenticatenia bacterium]|nr:MAG: ECF transporter S component [Ardenticatenia bacterium]